MNELTRLATDRPTDEELARLIAAGQVEVFAQLYARYYDRAYRLAWAMTGRREAAEELTQEIFLRAWQKAGQFRGEASFGRWFYRLATHCCLNFRRRLPARAHESLDAVEQAPQTDGMKQIEANVRRQEIQGEVQRLEIELAGTERRDSSDLGGQHFSQCHSRQGNEFVAPREKTRPPALEKTAG